MNWEVNLYFILGIIVLSILYKILVYLLTPIMRDLYDCLKGIKGFSKPQIRLERKVVALYNDLIKLPFNDLANINDASDEFVIDDRRGKVDSQTLLIDKDKIFVSILGTLRYFNERKNQNYKTYRGFIKRSNGDIETINNEDTKKYELQTKLFGEFIDIHESWLITSIVDKISFVSKIIEYVPINSIWYIEGIFDAEIKLALSSYFIRDKKNIKLISRIPKENIYKIVLNEESKKVIIQSISRWNLDKNFYHTQIYDGDKFYLMSLNRFKNKKTWISFDYPRSVLNDLEEGNIIKFHEAS